ncbi:hypothetical protein CP985_05725 [Malaciobacter mytili LMG 24559]|uniref:Uncharacterized protein n=1 Tax=Malaciobacter mytili LMG 24559 TaxID=1032238 RepID=A0AAX2AGV5_9BACT|nr:hypothetical protein [Malaciobacter mytili]AXH14351.1 hypothetical protein AMYT_0758 [Malaciobacter mytili LMG 24559]RXK16073.1 hypothetical protein CP985_05725 [Malaciobacter mytili LMG 24559]
MNREKFERAKKIDDELKKIKKLYELLYKYKSFKDNHSCHGVQLVSASENRGIGFEAEGNIFSKEDIDKIVNTVDHILIAKKVKLEKEFKEI